MIRLTIDRYYFPEKYDKALEAKKQTFFEVFESYLQKRKLSDVREKNFRVLERALRCYEVVAANPTTGKEEKRPLNEIASSHLARRTFVGNLYKQVKDPNLVGSLSGYTEGSKAFARYRDIDEEMKKDLVKLIE